jgi:cysteine desulfurase
VQHVYFDHNATTPVAPEVLRSFTADGWSKCTATLPVSIISGRRPSSGWKAARRQVAARIGCAAQEIVFTSGGTESDNLAIFGIARGKSGAHVITSAIEHPAVLNACARLEREGVAVTWLSG